MAKRIVSEQEYEEVLDAIQQYPFGATLENLLNQLQNKVPRRTLQRRLSHLVQNGSLLFEGNARARKYKLPISPSWIIHESSEFPFEISLMGDDIKKQILKPIHMRTPVGYNRKFLDNYRPNTTSYLTSEIVQKLMEAGKTQGERPAGTYAKEIYNRLLIDLSWNSSRLEGNTYSLLETERLLKMCEVIEGKDVKEARMILNHKDAIEFLVDSNAEIGVNRPTFLTLHALLSHELMKDIKACGRLRTIPIGIGKSVYHPISIPHIIEECFQQIIDTASAIKNPFEQAFFLMVHLPYLQPFEDVNKRVSRLAANIPLIVHNLCPLSFVDVPQEAYIHGLLGVYELNKIELLREVFVWAYERSCLHYNVKTIELGKPDIFHIKYRQQIREIISIIVSAGMNKTNAATALKKYAQNLPKIEQEHFIEIVEKDLLGLHEGNIAIYKIKRSVYEQWQRAWQ